MTRVRFIRHGKRHREMGDPGLTAEGRSELVHVSELLSGWPIDAVFTSPLRRAAETAQGIGEALGLPVEVDDRLRERMNWGDVEGQSFEEFVELWNRCSLEREFAPPGGDSSMAAGQRVEAFVRDRAAEFVGGEVVAVCHGGLIGDFLLNVLSERDLAAVSPEFVADPYSGVVLPECSMTVVSVEPDRYRLEAVGVHLVASDGDQPDTV